MSELFPGRRRVVGGNEGGLGRMVNFMGATQVPEVSNAFGEVENFIQTYQNNHYNKISNDRFDAFSSQVMEAAETFDFSKDASEFDVLFRDQLNSLAEGLPVENANRFLAAGSSLLTSQKAKLVGKAFELDQADQRTKDFSELSSVLNSISSSISDASYSLVNVDDTMADDDLTFLPDYQNSVFQNLEENIEEAIETLDSKIEELAQSGRYRGNEKLLLDYRSESIRSITEKMSFAHMIGFSELDLASIAGQAQLGQLPEQLSSVEDFYNELNPKDRDAYATVIAEKSKQILGYKKIYDNLILEAISPQVTSIIMDLKESSLLINPENFKAASNSAQIMIDRLYELGAPKEAKSLEVTLFSEASTLRKSQIDNAAASIILGSNLQVLQKQYALMGIPKEYLSTLEEVQNIVGNDTDKFNKIIADKISSNTKIISLDKSINDEKKAVINKAVAAQALRNRVLAIAPYSTKNELDFITTNYESASKLPPADAVEVYKKIEDYLNAIKERNQSTNNLYLHEKGSTPNNKAVDQQIGIRSTSQLQNIFLNASDSSQKGTKEHTNANNTLSTLKGYLEQGYGSNILNNLINEIASQPTPTSEQEIQARNENLLILGQSLNVLVGSQSPIFDVGINRFAGLGEKARNFAKDLMIAADSGFSASMFGDLHRRYNEEPSNIVVKAQNERLKKVVEELNGFASLRGLIPEVLSTGDSDDFPEVLSGYAQRLGQTIMNAAPGITDEALKERIKEKLVQAGVGFAKSGWAMGNIEENFNLQRYSLNPPEKHYSRYKLGGGVDAMIEFNSFVSNELKTKSNIPTNTSFLIRPNERRQKNPYRLFSSDDAIPGVNMWLKYKETSPIDKPQYSLVIISQGGIPMEIKNKQGQTLLIDFNARYEEVKKEKEAEIKRQHLEEISMRKRKGRFGPPVMTSDINLNKEPADE